jgi:hypothetical protein
MAIEPRTAEPFESEAVIAEADALLTLLFPTAEGHEVTVLPKAP